MLKKITLSLTLCWVSLVYALSPEQATSFSPKPLVSGHHSMIVTNNPWASLAAQQILQSGGNAVDAAIAAGFVLGLTEPQSSGIGGGGYALTYSNKTHQILAYDGREVAPKRVTPEWFLNKNGMALNNKIAMLSAKSIGVPGEVALFYKLHQQQGKLPWKKLLIPAIHLAQSSFPMSQRLHYLLNSDKKILQRSEQIKKIYFNGTIIKPIGSFIKNNEYAKTLTIISENPNVFYQGQLAHEMITSINQMANENIFTLYDFKNYKIKINAPLCFNYRETYRICSIPPSSAGGITLQEFLRIYALNYQGINYNDSHWLYYFLEASKLAYADRDQYIADPDFVKQPIVGLLEKKYLLNRSKLIGKNALKTPVTAGIPIGVKINYASDYSKPLPGTTSITIVDKGNNAISMTLTIEHQFGSHLFTHGFFLNNELTDFSLYPTNAQGKLIANRVEAGKRPRSSIAPTLVFTKDGQLYALTGSPGGNEIICYVAKNLILMLDMHMTPDAASALPNLCAANNTPIIEAITPAQKQFLQQMDEIPIQSHLVSSATNILHKINGDWYGAADPRREGIAIGE